MSLAAVGAGDDEVKVLLSCRGIVHHLVVDTEHDLSFSRVPPHERGVRVKVEGDAPTADLAVAV